MLHQIQGQTVEVVKEIPQEIEVEKLTDEDVDEMILETHVDGDSAVQNSVPPEDVSTVTVEVEEPKIKTVVMCMCVCP